MYVVPKHEGDVLYIYHKRQSSFRLSGGMCGILSGPLSPVSECRFHMNSHSTTATPLVSTNFWCARAPGRPSSNTDRRSCSIPMPRILKTADWFMHYSFIAYTFFFCFFVSIFALYKWVTHSHRYEFGIGIKKCTMHWFASLRVGDLRPLLIRHTDHISFKIPQKSYNETKKTFLIKERVKCKVIAKVSTYIANAKRKYTILTNSLP